MLSRADFLFVSVVGLMSVGTPLVSLVAMDAQGCRYRYKTRDVVKTYLNVTFEDLLKRSGKKFDLCEGGSVSTDPQK